MGRFLILVVIGLAVAGGLAFVLLEIGTDAESVGGDMALDPLSERAPDRSTGPVLQASRARVTDLSRGEPGLYLIKGRVVDESGEPAANIPVAVRRTGNLVDYANPSSRMKGPREQVHEAVRVLSQPEEDPAPRVATARSDAEGLFEIAITRSGRYSVRAEPTTPRFGTSRTLHLQPWQPTLDVLLSVRPGSRLVGRLVNLPGKALSATMEASWWKREGATSVHWNSERIATDPDDGRFTFEAVPPGTLRLSLRLASGRSLSSVSVVTPQEGEVVIRVDDATGGMSLTVTDAAGTPIADATVVVSVRRKEDKAESAEARAGGLESVHGKTGSEGVCTLPDAPLGKVTHIRIAAEGCLVLDERAGRATWAGSVVSAESVLKLAIVMDRGGTVSGVVKIQGSETPLADATVTLHPLRTNTGMGRRLVPARARTDAQGRYELTAVAKGRYVAIPEHVGYYLPQFNPRPAGTRAYDGTGPSAPAELSVAVTEEGARAERDLILAKGLSVKGRVVDATGLGVADAQVHARGYRPRQRAARWGVHHTGDQHLARSGRDGAFTLDGLPAHDQWVLYAQKSGYAGRFGQPFALAESAETADIQLELTAGATIRGTVEGLEAAAFAAAQVSFFGVGTELADNRRSQKIQPDGSFEFVGLPPGTWTVYLRVKGRPATRQEVADLKEGEVREGIVVTVRTGVEVNGMLIDKAGDPVPRTSIMLQPLSGRGEQVHTATDAKGQFTFLGVAEGRVQLLTWGPTGRSPLGEPFDAPASDVRVVFEKQAVVKLKGEVLDPDGNPIPFARILIRGTHPRTSSAPRFPTPKGAGSDVLNGAFEVRVAGTVPYSARVSGASDTAGKALNFLEKWHRIESADEEIVIRLEHGAELIGTVLDAQGQAVADCPIRVSGRVERTDAEGRFRFVGVRAGRVDVLVGPMLGYAKPALQQCTAPATDVKFTLEKGLTIKGRAEGPDGKPPQKSWLRATWKHAGASASGRHNQGSATALVQSDGSFTLGGLPAGVSVDINIQASAQTEGGGLAPTQVRGVRPGTTGLVLRMSRGVSVEGTVMDHNGKLAAGVWVWATRADGEHTRRSGQAQTDSKGGWKLSGLHSARYKITVMRQGSSLVPDPIEVDAPASGIQLTLPESLTLRGRLSGLSATEDTKWTIILLDGKGAIQRSAQASADGTWQIPGVAADAGFYVCASSENGDRYAKQGPITGAGQGITLTLRQGLSISGRVDRRAVPEGRVNVWVNEGWFARGQVENDGTFVIRGLPSGNYTLHARCGSGRARREKVEAGATGVALVLAIPE